MAKTKKKKRSPLLGRPRMSTEVVQERVAEAKWYRKKHGMSVKDAVSKVGVSQSAWSNWHKKIKAKEPAGMTNPLAAAVPVTDKIPSTRQEFMELELERANQKLDDQKRLNLDLVRIVTQQIANK